MNPELHSIMLWDSDHGVAVPGSDELQTSKVSGYYHQQYGVTFFVTSTPTPLSHLHIEPYDTFTVI